MTTGRGRKRKTEGEAATPTDKKAKKEAEVREVIDRYSSRFTLTHVIHTSMCPCTQMLKTVIFQDAKEEAGDSKEASLTSRQQSAVAQALAAGVPGGQQR